MDLDRETFLINQERERIWNAIYAHAHGDMGPANVYLKDIAHIFTPEPSTD